MSFSSVANRFHTRGAATENARSPNRRSVRGRKRLPLLEARSDDRVGMSATGVSRSEMSSGVWPTNVLYERVDTAGTQFVVQSVTNATGGGPELHCYVV